MRALVRGWGRNRGEKEIVENNSIERFVDGSYYSFGSIYWRPIETWWGKREPKYRVTMSAEVNLCGKYFVHLELGKSEIEQLYCETHDDNDIARLFYKKFGHKEIGDIVRLLVSLKDEEEKETRKAAMYKSAVSSLIEDSETK
jgi:hypothetical protein